MKLDFRTKPAGAEADAFRAWLEQETIDGLRRSYGDGKATQAAIFLYVNRAYEAHLPESEIGGIFGTCVVRAGYQERDEEPAIAWLEFSSRLAARDYE